MTLAARTPVRAEGLRWAPGGAELFDGFSLALAPGTVTALVGPSGCGKSSLLRVLAGLRPPDGGRVEGASGARAFVFQDPALLPWLDVRANVSLPGRFAPIGVAEGAGGARSGISPEDADAAVARVGLSAHADKLPAQLSGGQRMRVSLARALVTRADFVLLDEPFAALDGLTRASVQDVFLELQRLHGWTVLMVTHELEDAVRMAHRVVAVVGPPLRIVDDREVSAETRADPGAVAARARSLAALFAGHAA